MSCVLVQILCQLEANGLAVVGSEHTGPQDRIALALYPTASMMNHACLPNLALQFAGRSLRARWVFYTIMRLHASNASVLDLTSI